MASWSKKIYLSFWLTLAFVTGVAVLWLPSILDQGKEDSIKDLEAAPSLTQFTDQSLGQAVTRFPTRPFLESVAATQPATRPTTTAPPPESSGGIPTRVVEGMNAGGEEIGERVTTRAYLRANSSVFVSPQTTAQIMGRVGSQTKVRWLAKAGEGWEEILLKDGRSAFVQTQDISFSADSSDDLPVSQQQQRTGDGPDLETLPGTVESFLAQLSRDDLLRAETYLSPQAPSLSRDHLGTLAAYVGGPAEGRVHRIELGGRPSYRRVIVVYGPELAQETGTLWEWDSTQQRWMLIGWD